MLISDGVHLRHTGLDTMCDTNTSVSRLVDDRCISRLAEECGARLMGVAEEGILEELRARIMEGKGKVSMPQVRT